jgi:hypothetical protein
VILFFATVRRFCWQFFTVARALQLEFQGFNAATRRRDLPARSS